MNAELHDYLRRMVDANASDLFFSVGAPPALKIDGRISPLGPVVLSAEAVDALARQAMNERQQREFEAWRDCARRGVGQAIAHVHTGLWRSARGQRGDFERQTRVAPDNGGNGSHATAQ